MGLSKLYWKIFHRVFIIFQFILRKIYYFYFVKKIKKIIRKKEANTYYFIYDMSVSPIAYGEVFDCLMFVRSLQALGKKVVFVFTKDTIRQDYKKIIKKKKLLNKRLYEIKKLSEKLIQKENIIFRKKDLSYYIKEKNLFQKNILFFETIKKKIPLYKFTHNLCFYVFNNMSNLEKQKFFLNKKEFKLKSKFKTKFKNYFSIGVRMSIGNEKERNINFDDLNHLIEKIRKNNSNYNIVIVSDLESFKIIKKNKKFLLNRNIFFSKKYFTNFIDDGAIILNSKKYFQYKGTGIQMYAEFSRIDFDIFHNLNDYTIFADILRSDLYFNYSRKIKNIWQTKNQRFLDQSRF